MTGMSDSALLECVSNMNHCTKTTIHTSQSQSKQSRDFRTNSGTNLSSRMKKELIIPIQSQKPPLPPKPKVIPPKPEFKLSHVESVKIIHNSLTRTQNVTINNNRLLSVNNSNYSNNISIKNDVRWKHIISSGNKPAPPPRNGSYVKSPGPTILFNSDLIESLDTSPTDESDLIFSPTRHLDHSSTYMENTLEQLDEAKPCSDVSSGSISDSDSDGEPKECIFRDSHDASNLLFVSPINQFGSRVSMECDSDTNNINGLSEDEKRLRKAFLIAKEIMTTEDSFVNILKLLNITFRDFLSNKGCVSTAKSANQGTKAIPQVDLNQILKHLPNLQNLNEGLLGDFKTRIADWENRPIIADVIVEKGPFLKIYATYIKEIENQTSMLEECADRYTFFGQSLREFEASDDSLHLPVGRHLLAPMQRITRYKDLMNRYLKQLREGDDDYHNALQAFDIVQEVVEHSNEAIRQLDNFSHLLSLQERLNGTTDSSSPPSGGAPLVLLIEPGRSLIKEDQVLKLCRRGVRVVYLILLSDSLLYTTQVPPIGPRCGLKLNYKMALHTMKVDVPLADEFNTEVSIISTSRSFTIRVRSPSERDAWLHALQDAITTNASRRNSFQLVSEGYESVTNLEGLGRQAPVWIPDDRVTMCQLCTTEFTLTFRRHHCRACGKVICKLCSHNRCPLTYLGSKRVRVCDLCFDKLERENDGSHNSSDSSKAEIKSKKGPRDSHRWRSRKKPERLMEVCGSDLKSQMSGYLRHSSRKGIWRLAWFVLKERVLYEYAAPQDVCALSSLPVLGYTIHCEDQSTDNEEAPILVAFELHHENQPPIIFEAPTSELATKWISIMHDAVKL